MADYGDDELALLEAVRRFAAEVLAPAAAEMDETGRSATMHLDSLAGMGLMGLSIPEAYGGLGLRPTALFEAVAVIAGACGSLPGAAGKSLGAFALTEP